MAQWTGQFGGLTHETKVQDIEQSLRQAIKTFEAASEAERTGKLKAIQHLSERLLAARLKALRARISALIQPGSERLDERQTAHLQARKQELEAQSADDILKEFGFLKTP
jgi:hypothetical protein